MPAGEHLKQLRQRFGFSLRDVERLTEGRLRSGHLSQIETGRVQQPSLSVLRELAGVFQMSVSELVDMLHQPQPDIASENEKYALAYLKHLHPARQQMALEFLRYLVLDEGRDEWQDPDADRG